MIQSEQIIFNKDILEPVNFVKTDPIYQVTVGNIEIISYVDNTTNKTITAYTNGLPGEIILWEGEDYDKIGEWGVSEVIERITELFKNK